MEFKLRHHHCVGLLLAALATGAAAETPAGFQPGYYVGVQTGRIEGIKDPVARDGRPSFGANFGYRYAENLAVELFTRSLSFELIQSNWLPSYDYPTHHIGVAALASLPLSPQLKLYGRAGLGQTGQENSKGHSGGYRFEPSAGAGLSYDFGKTFGVKLEATRFTRSKVSTYTLGGEWRF